jgi:hypothetical protein
MPKGVYERKEGWVSPTSFKKGCIGYWKGKKIPYKSRPSMKGRKKPQSWFDKMIGRTAWNKGISYHAREKHWNWQGGKTILSSQICSLFKNRQWRSDVFQRDNYTCQECGIKGGNLHCHHIKQFAIILDEYNIKTLEDAINCEELWNINNGLTLCRECHRKTDTYGNSKKRR